MRISDWSSDVCSSDLIILYAVRSPSLRQRLRNQLPAVRYSIKRNETAHARTLRGAQKGFIQRLEPIAQSFEPALLADRSEEHTSELQSLMRISYAVFCLKKKNNTNHNKQHLTRHHNSHIIIPNRQLC